MVQPSEPSDYPVTISIPVFEGPLELLLHLLRQNQVDIFDIPIATITAQYLELVTLVQQYNLAELGDYLVMAATLIEIKSRLLLPGPASVEGEDEGDPRAELVARLLEYERVRESAEFLADCEEARREIWFRLGGTVVDGWTLPLTQAEADPAKLVNSLQRVLARVGVQNLTPEPPLARRRVSLRLKMAELLRRLQGAATAITFDELFDRDARTREVVMTFLALLELMRRGRVSAEQKSGTAPIRIQLARQEEPAATH